MFDPTQPEETPRFRAQKQSRSWAQRARAPFWMLAGLIAVLACSFFLSTARAVFRDRYTPPTLPPDQAALIASPLPSTPAPTPQAVAAVPTVSWTTLMVLQTDGTYTPPPQVSQQIEAAWRGAIDSLNLLPWEPTPDLALYFTDAALRSRRLMQVSPVSPTEKTVVGDRRFLVEGCDPVGTICDVSEAQNKVSVEGYDAASHRRVTSRALDANLVYILSGTLRWVDGRWKVSALNAPDVITLNELHAIP